MIWFIWLFRYIASCDSFKNFYIFSTWIIFYVYILKPKIHLWYLIYYEYRFFFQYMKYLIITNCLFAQIYLFKTHFNHFDIFIIVIHFAFSDILDDLIHFGYSIYFVLWFILILRYIESFGSFYEFRYIHLHESHFSMSMYLN